MRKILLLLLLILISCNKEEFSKFDSIKKYNFGKAKVGDTIKYKFKLKNIADKPLEIYNIGTSCSCTGAIISDSIIEKNNYATILVSYVPTTQNVGSVKNSIVVEANTNPIFTTLYLEGIIEK